MFIRYLERLVDVRGLISDPWDLGGGVHLIRPGGRLNIHTDFPFHPQLRIWRKINVLVYLNEDWLDEWEGKLELWPPDLSRCAKSISPIFNRMVIFRTDNVSFHGHPSPLRTPSHVYRKSIALYYYSSDLVSLPSDPHLLENSHLLPTNFTDVSRSAIRAEVSARG